MNFNPNRKEINENHKTNFKKKLMSMKSEKKNKETIKDVNLH
jgi:hypothetical protein